MSHYSHAFLTIDCPAEQAKDIEIALDFMQEAHNHVEILSGQTNEEALTYLDAHCEHQLLDSTKSLVVELAKFTRGETILFDCRYDHKTQHLILETDTSEDGLFYAAHRILALLDSDQVISTGVAYTEDQPSDEHAFEGNFVAISKHSYQYLVNEEDRIAVEAAVAQGIEYWIATYEGENAHPATVLFISPQKLADEEVLHGAIGRARETTNLPANIDVSDFAISPLNPPAFESMKRMLPVIDIRH